MSRSSLGNDLTRKESLVTNLKIWITCRLQVFPHLSYAIQRLLGGAVSVYAEASVVWTAQESGIIWTWGGNKTHYRPRTLNATILLATAQNQSKRFPAGHCLIKLLREISPTQLTTMLSPRARLARRSWLNVTAKHLWSLINSYEAAPIDTWAS